MKTAPATLGMLVFLAAYLQMPYLHMHGAELRADPLAGARVRSAFFHVHLPEPVVNAERQSQKPGFNSNDGEERYPNMAAFQPARFEYAVAVLEDVVSLAEVSVCSRRIVPTEPRMNAPPGFTRLSPRSPPV